MGLLQATATYAAAALAAATLACPVSHEALFSTLGVGSARERPVHAREEARRLGEAERAMQWGRQASARTSEQAR